MIIDQITEQAEAQIRLKLPAVPVVSQASVYPDEKGLPFINVTYGVADKDDEAVDGLITAELMIEIITRPNVPVSGLVVGVMSGLKEDLTLNGLVLEMSPLGISRQTEQGEYRINYAVVRIKIQYPADEWEF